MTHRKTAGTPDPVQRRFHGPKHAGASRARPTSWNRDAARLIQRGERTHRRTTDLAAHRAGSPGGFVPGVQVSRIDPKVKAQHHGDPITAEKPPDFDAGEQAL